jgi:hypothetical protein
MGADHFRTRRDRIACCRVVMPAHIASYIEKFFVRLQRLQGEKFGFKNLCYSSSNSNCKETEPDENRQY